MKTEKFHVQGMTCASCQANITRGLQKLEGVSEVDVSLLANQMTVTYDESCQTDTGIINAVDKLGYGASPVQSTKEQNNDFRSEWQTRKGKTEEEQHSMKRRLLTSFILLIPLMYIAMGPMISLPVPSIFTGMENVLISAFTQVLLTIPILVINGHFFTSGIRALLKKMPNMDSLIAIGSGASFFYGLFAIYRMMYGFGHNNMSLVHEYAHSLYFESSAMILTLVTLGKYLEARSKAKTTDALGKLVDLAPKTATVIRDGKEHTIPSEQVAAGDIVVIRPGESIPVDGTLTEGYGYVDQAAITGESIPVEKNPGDEVISATINKNGTFRFRASKVGEDTTLSQIIRLVDEAGNTKAPIARLADKISGIFVPIVIALAIITCIVWILAGQSFEFALSCAISILVISCPCALGLATPVAIMVGTGKAAEYGILVKSAVSLENLHSIDTIVLDKTGTITSGHPSVTDILLFDENGKEISSADTKEIDSFLTLAATIESGSEHPLAEAIVEAAKEKNLSTRQAESFEMTAGRGIRAVLDNTTYYAGNLAFLEEMKLTSVLTPDWRIRLDSFAKEGKTPLLFATDTALLGMIAVADTIRATSLEAIKEFQKMGLNVVMLTGDHPLTAQAICKRLGLTDVIAGVLPTQKESHIRTLQAQGRRVAMVGDGINDAPALMRADIGIAIGAGTDIAIDSADVVLMKDSLLDVVTAIHLSHSVIRNIHMNLFWAFFYNILGIPVAAGILFPFFGILLNPMIASAAMSLSSVCVVTNALRLRFFKAKELTIHASGQSLQKQPMLNQSEQDQKELYQENQINKNEKGLNTMKKEITIEGMSCNHCKKHVEDALSAVSGVSIVEVTLEPGKAVVTMESELSDQLLMDTVNEAGYSAVDCKTL